MKIEWPSELELSKLNVYRKAKAFNIDLKDTARDLGERRLDIKKTRQVTAEAVGMMFEPLNIDTGKGMDNLVLALALIKVGQFIPAPVLIVANDFLMRMRPDYGTPYMITSAIGLAATAAYVGVCMIDAGITAGKVVRNKIKNKGK